MNRQDMVEAGAQGIIAKLAEFHVESDDAVSLQLFYARAVLDAVLPQITDAKQLLTLAKGSVVVGRSGNAFTRMSFDQQPWRGANGGYGATTGDLVEISQRMFLHEGPLTLVWRP